MKNVIESIIEELAVRLKDGMYTEGKNEYKENACRLIFPRKYTDGRSTNQRISEQEARFVFIQ